VTDTAAPTAHGDSGRPAPRPTREQLAAWRAFLRAHASITRALEAELEAEQDLSLASYDVLVQLAEAPDRRLRMTELADAVLLSRSGVTRLVDRLEKSGLVARCRVASDGRGVAARLTEAGLDRLRTASRTHLRGVGQHFVNRLDEADLRILERISRHLAG
jgi:DNA-binding MarR family transcriptional regulator